MRVGDLLLWMTGVTRVTMFGRKSVGSGLTTRHPPLLRLLGAVTVTSSWSRRNVARAKFRKTLTH
jgi:hypothetical protein